MTEKRVPTKKTRVMADGSIKIYDTTRKYTVKGHVDENGKVSKFSPEQIAEMKRRFADGVTKKRLCDDYGCSMPKMMSILKEQCVK